MELVSVIIPTCNRAEVLKCAIQSVLNQSYSNFEIIIVDDASTDNTGDTISTFNNEKIKYIKLEKSKGGNYARNFGVENSTGNFIAFLDDDDEWFPSKLEKQMLVFDKRPDVGLVYSGVELIFSGIRRSYISMPKKSGDLSKDILFTNIIGTTSTVVVKRNIFYEAGTFDVNMTALQDYDLWIRIAQITLIGCVNNVLLKYYIRPNGNQISNNILKFENSMKIIEMKYKKLFSNLTIKEQKARRTSYNNMFGLKNLKIGNRRVARRFFIKALKNRLNLKSLVLYFASFLGYDFLLKLKSTPYKT